VQSEPIPLQATAFPLTGSAPALRQRTWRFSSEFAISTAETVTLYCAVAALSEFAWLDAEQAIVQSARGIGPYGHGKRATDTVRISPPIALSA
jgi:hypothetical protein